jgi:hypothetical protein
MITPSGVTRANVPPVGCPDKRALDWVDPLECARNAFPPPLEGFGVTNSTRKMPAINVSRLIETRKLKKPPSPLLRRTDVGCRVEFVFIVGVSDEWLNLVSFKNGRQQFFWFRIVGRDLTRLGIARRLQGELEVVARRCVANVNQPAAAR